MDHGIHCLGLSCPDSYQPPDLPSTIKYWERVGTERYDPFMLKPTLDVCNAEMGRAISKLKNIFNYNHLNQSLPPFYFYIESLFL